MSAPTLTVEHLQHQPSPAPTGVRVVLVDDSPQFRGGMLRALRRAAGVGEVVDASDGASGLQVIREFLPDVAVVDDRMPGLGGIDVARAVRDDPTTRDVRVVVLSGTPTAALEERAREAGAVLTLDKGATRRELCDAIAGAASA